ncbi:MAG: tetratricopeptide repeat protein [Lachnospiraceae bacterium]|nr:tetratricopeptide repeat protein [Lachnospiraceae bacterium]
MKKMRLTAVLLSAVLLMTGCTLNREEKQDKLKETAIENIGAGDYENALSNLNEALTFAGGKVTDREVDICYYKGAVQYLLTDTAGAIDTYSGLILYDDTDAWAYYLRGSLYLKEKESELALKDYKKAVKVSNNDYELYIQIYENLNAQDYRDEGLEFLNLALEIEGSSANQLFWRGRIYLILEQYDAAEKVLLSAVEKGNAEANIYLAQAYRGKGDEDKADEVLSSFAKEASATSVGLQVLGDIYMEDGEYEQAYEAYEKALSLDDVSNKKQLMKNEIGALEYMGDFSGALEKANEYILEYPSDTDVLKEITFLTTRV